MKHELVKLIETSIDHGIGIAIDLLEMFNHGDYDFGMDGVLAIDGSESALEFDAEKDKAASRLKADVDRAVMMSKMLAKMDLDEDGLYSEDDFAELFGKVGADGVLVSDVEGLISEICLAIIPAIINYKVERYADTCLKWLSVCDFYNKNLVVNEKRVLKLKAMAEVHSLKMIFCDAKNIQKRSVGAL